MRHDRRGRAAGLVPKRLQRCASDISGHSLAPWQPAAGVAGWKGSVRSDPESPHGKDGVPGVTMAPCVCFMLKGTLGSTKSISRDDKGSSSFARQLVPLAT